MEEEEEDNEEDNALRDQKWLSTADGDAEGANDEGEEGGGAGEQDGDQEEEAQQDGDELWERARIEKEDQVR